MQTQKKNPHLVYAVAFSIVAIVAFVGLIAADSQADTTSQESSVANAQPTVDTVITAASSGGADDESLTLTENTNTTFYFHGTATDNNGCAEINNANQWSLKAFRTAVGAACAADNRNCYVGDNAAQLTLGATNACDANDPNDLDISYEWAVPVAYYADATDVSGSYANDNWTAQVSVSDDNDVSGTRSDTTEVETLIALNVTGSVNYGSVAIGADSSEQTIAVTNTGNEAIDYNVTGSGNMTCTTRGAINVGNVQYGLASGFGYGNGTALTESTAPVNASIARSTDGIASARNLYTMLRMPTGVAGTCSNSVTFIATSN